MKWQTIKDNAVAEFLRSSGIGHGSSPSSVDFALMRICYLTPPVVQKIGTRDLIKEFLEDGERIIQNFDVRMVNRLVEQFPKSVPPSWRGKKLLAEQNREGEWIIIVEP